jgi:hypothetical protein
MTRAVLLALTLFCALSPSAAANDPGEDAYMIRMLSCAGPDANMEVYWALGNENSVATFPDLSKSQRNCTCWRI